jgi:two-component system, NarL family, sensor histidine kinase UhpB
VDGEREGMRRLRADSLLLMGRSTLSRAVAVNSLVILAGAVLGTVLARRVSSEHLWIVMAAFFLGGAAVTTIANYLVLRAAFQPLVDLSSSMATIHRGMSGEAVRRESYSPDLRAMTEALEAMLDRLEGESRAYSLHIFESIEDERRRIGRELHDETSQSLAAALLNIDTALLGVEACSPEMRAQIINARTLIAHCLAQVKLLLYDLRPSVLDDFGLVPALRWYVQSHLQVPGLVAVVDLDGVQRRLPQAVETALFRIAQESLANVVKHARATRVLLRVEAKPAYVTLLVSDNGVGFDPASVPGDPRERYGVGLMSMRERATALHGTINVESAPGRGTRVHAVIPLEGETAGGPPATGAATAASVARSTVDPPAPGAAAAPAAGSSGAVVQARAETEEAP